MRKTMTVLGVLSIAAFSAPAFAQDSVSINPGLPGDAVSPYADINAVNGSEQCNDYIVDLCKFQTSKGWTFALAPIVKSANVDPLFFNNLISAQGISRKQIRNVLPSDLPSNSYAAWGGPGFGINNDPAINMVPGSGVPNRRTNQFAVAYSDFGGPYNGVTGALVNVGGTAPTTLYVSRRQAANNGCMAGANLAQIGFGSVNEAGAAVFRADDFGVGVAACGVTPLVDDNIFIADMAARNCNIQNVVSNSFPLLFDATSWIVRNDINGHNVPAILPTAVSATPFYIGSNFLTQYVRGTAFPPTADMSHLAVGVVDHRGNVSYTCSDCGFLASSAGVAGVLGTNAAGTTIMNVFGLNPAGNVTGKLAIPIPANVVDNCVSPLRQNIAGANEFNHYHSQVAFRGGNGQIALGTDAAGRLLAAAEVDHPAPSGNNSPLNYILVARVDCASGMIQYTMAGYVGSADPNAPTVPLIDGKPICDATGAIIGQMAPLGSIPGAPLGPSISAPMIDSAGNVWFLSAIELYNTPGPGQSTFTSGLLRSIYDPVNFCYNTELVFTNHQVFLGKNSLLPYEISFLSIADADSVNSGTAWSQNISDVPHLSMTKYLNGPANAQSPSTEEDPRCLGGMVINAEITYDWDQDGTFDPTLGFDQDYQVLLYVGAATPNADLDGDGDVDTADFTLLGQCFAGSNVPPAASCNASVDADLDGDGDVDVSDAALFGQQYTGSL